MIVELLVVLVAAKLAAEVAERLRAPAVLGEIVAGVIVGPAALGLVGGGETLHFLGELGVILLLLEVGLETDLGELRAVGRASLIVAFVGVALPFAGGLMGMLALGQDSSAAVFVGAALTATSVGITARVFGDLRALATIEARTVLGAAVADDVLGLIILTVVVKLTTGGGVSALDVVVVLGAAVGFLVVATAVSLKATPPAFRLVDRFSRSSGAVLVTAVALTLALAAVAELAGLAAIIGAFVAGLALAKTDRAERVRRDLSPIAAVLVPVFFLQIGIEAELSVFGDPEVLAIAGVLLVVAVVGKIAAAAGMFGSRGDKLLVGLGMLPRGEVGLIFAGIGLAEGVLNDDLYAALLVVVLGSTLVTPPVLRWRIGAVQRSQRPALDATPVPEGGWLVVSDGVVVLRGTPPAELALVLAMEAAVLVADARPGPRLLQWFLNLAPGDRESVEWTPAARAEFVAVLKYGNERSWRFLEAVGLLEVVLPELAVRLDERRADASELDPAGIFTWATLEGVRHLVDGRASDALVLSALVLDAVGPEAGGSADAVNAAVAIAERIGFDAVARDDVALLVGERGTLRAAADRRDALAEYSVVQLATHLGTAERADDLYALELADTDLEGWERDRLAELHHRLTLVLAQPDVAESRRGDAEMIASTPAAKARVRAASRPWLLTQPSGAIARQAELLDPLLRAGQFRVVISGARIDIATRDRDGLLAAVAAVLTACGIDVRTATTATWPDGAVAMAFIATHTIDADAAVLTARLTDSMHQTPEAAGVPDAHVTFDHRSSPWYTILDAVASDRPGLLAALAAACSAAGASIHGVVASTEMGVAKDRFELTDGRGRKLDASTCELIRTVLSGVVPPSRRTRNPLTRTKQSSDRVETARP